MQFRVLGSLEVHRGQRPVVIGSSSQRTILAALLAEAGKVVPVDALADALWGEQQPADPRNAIQTYVARLRETLGRDAPIITRSPGYVLDVEPHQVDALRFEQLLTEAQRRRAQPATVRDLLDEALGLWHGPAYAEFADGVARAEALRLPERRLVALEERAAARLSLGEAADLVGELDALVAQHPLRERFVALHMRALTTVDRRAEALAAFRAYRERLADETGLEPSAAIRDLEGEILRGEAAEPAPARSMSAAEDRLRVVAAVPSTPTSLVGRAAEIADVRALLGRERLVTLTGPGGVGKTRVAAEVARAIGHDDGEVVWIELAPVGDPAAVDHLVAAASASTSPVRRHRVSGCSPPWPPVLRFSCWTTASTWRERSRRSSSRSSGAVRTSGCSRPAASASRWTGSGSVRWTRCRSPPVGRTQPGCSASVPRRRTRVSTYPGAAR